MLQKIIESAAYLLGDQKCLQDLSAYNSDSSIETNSPIYYYIALINFVISDIAKNYNCYKTSQQVTSTSSGEVALSSLTHSAVIIKRVKDNSDRAVKFGVSMDKLYDLSPNTTYKIDYCYYPEKIENLSSNITLPVGLDYTTVCYGAMYEFFASKMQFAEADFWLSRYKQGLRILGHKYYDLKFKLGD